MILSISERIALPMLIPKTGNMIEIMLMKDLRNKLDFTPEEITDCGIKMDGEFIRWDKDTATDIQLSPEQISILKSQVKILDESKQITENILDLCVKINQS